MTHEVEPSKTYPVLPHIRDRAQVQGREAYQEIYRASVRDPEAFWARQAERLDWFHPWRQTLDWDFRQSRVSWFAGGKLNISHNCVDRHLADRGKQTAIIWEADRPGEGREITYQELHAEVCRIANVLTSFGIGKGDRVCVYLPMIPELAMVMLACARVGAVHSVVFAGFSADSVRDRILDCGAKMVVTANEGFRGGKSLKLKEIVDEAVKGVAEVQTVLVARRSDYAVNMQAGRDVWLDEEMARQRPVCPARWMDAEDPLYIL